jgi:acyl-CoA synthetase (AMP-forming)/AMP-acid ligase II
MNAKLHSEEFRTIIENSEAVLTIASADLAQAVARHGRTIVTDTPDWDRLYTGEGMAMAPRQPDDLAWLFYTSGTTGRPKGAMLTHRNLLMAVLSYNADVDHVGPDDAILHAAPISHGSGINGLGYVAQGGNNIIPESASFDPGEIAALVNHWRNVSFFAAPTMVSRLVNNPAFASSDNPGLKTINYGGGPMHVEDLLRALDLMGPRLSQLYGQGEAPMTITALPKWIHANRTRPRWRAIMGSVGTPRTDVEVKVVDADDRDVEAGAIGEIVCRGDVVMAGYWRNPKATAETLRGGWLHTGDMGSFDEEGFLTLKDRSKDLIISGGSNIYPREVEEVLLRHPGVLEVSVIGRSHAEWGEEVVACVVARAGSPATEAELDALCLSSIARFKRPKAYVFLDALPKNNYGKVLKTALREQFNSAPSNTKPPSNTKH